MHTEIRAIRSVEELKKFLSVIITSFSTVAEEFGITEKSAPTNPAFITYDKLVDIFKKIKCFGFYYKDLPVGFFCLEESNNSLMMLEKLSILPEYRHKGYGKMILNYAVKFSSTKNMPKISIALINDNKKLKKWYSDYGFTETKVVDFQNLPFKVCFMEFNIKAGTY